MTQTVAEAAQYTVAKSYDELPYTSYPFQYATPENLRSIGVLFGLNPPELKQARVLELGCSDGGNVIRFAETYPGSYTLGIDISSIEVNFAQEKITALKLKNIEFKVIL